MSYCSLVPLQDHELVRIWDGMEWEDETEDGMSIGIEANGNMDETQTRQVLYLVTELFVWSFQQIGHSIFSVIFILLYYIII